MDPHTRIHWERETEEAPQPQRPPRTKHRPPKPLLISNAALRLAPLLHQGDEHSEPLTDTRSGEKLANEVRPLPSALGRLGGARIETETVRKRAALWQRAQLPLRRAAGEDKESAADVRRN
ncbi:transmembrane transporter [Striga asiatica]|uniref:Transmembrane transporter n=1 Tax=Striga asiatica TaxID=4170 RepID=A0A5A7Q4K4_STRAF|nr:transmembrane transporter [Striga asiatica]